MGCTLNCEPSWLSVFSPRIASIATRALNFGLYCFLVVVIDLSSSTTPPNLTLLPGLKSGDHYNGNDGEIEFAAYIGIDWADQKHACALQSSTESGVVQGELIHKPEAVEVWAADLYRQFGGRPIAIALEQSRGSLLFMLLKYEHLV